MRSLLRQPCEILWPRHDPLSVIVVIANIVQEAHSTEESLSFGTLAEPIFEPCTIDSDRAIRCKAEHASLPIHPHRLREEWDNKTGSILRLHKHNRVTKINAVIFATSHAIALKWRLF